MLIMQFIHGVLHSEMIGEFSPLSEGTKWVYSYLRKGDGIGSFQESLQITITVHSSSNNNGDSIALFNVLQSGNYIAPNNPMTNSTIAESFTDTVFFRSDSLWKSSSYRGRVFPLYGKHTINSDNLFIGTVNGISTHYFSEIVKTPASSVGLGGVYKKTIFVQNEGLYYHNFSSSTGSGSYSEETTISLISFNNVLFRLPVVFKDKKIHQSTPINSIKVLVSPQLYATMRNSNCYAINGKIFKKKDVLSSGYYLERVRNNSLP